MSDDLITLTTRVEALTGPCRETDDAIATALFTEKQRVCIKGLSDEESGMWTYRHPDGAIGSTFRFTASIDAAMTLVPEGWRIWTADSSVEGRTHWMLCGPKSRWEAGEDGEKCAGNDWYQSGVASTLALALTAAALRARAAIAQETQP